MAPTPDQLALVHVAKARLGLGDEQYRALLRRAAGVDSAKDLDDEGFRSLMVSFDELGFTSDFAAANLGHRLRRATPAQVALLRRLWADFTEGQGSDTSLGKWLEGRFKVSSLRFLAEPRARKAIGGLTRMIKRKAMKKKAS